MNDEMQKDYQNVYIYFTGGVTYGEMHLLRKLGKILNKNIMVGSPQIINSHDFLDIFINN